MILSKTSIIILFLAIAVCSCKSGEETTMYSKNVGDIAFDPKQDDASFIVCNEHAVPQYFQFTSNNHKDIKASVDSIFFNKFRNTKVNEDGLIRIRFIINCKGNAGRFRLTSMDWEYKEYAFDKRITSQLLAIIKNISIWNVQTVDGIAVDYYQYYIFKIQNGNLIEIMP